MTDDPHSARSVLDLHTAALARCEALEADREAYDSALNFLYELEADTLVEVSRDACAAMRAEIDDEGTFDLNRDALIRTLMNSDGAVYLARARDIGIFDGVASDDLVSFTSYQPEETTDILVVEMCYIPTPDLTDDAQYAGELCASSFSIVLRPKQIAANDGGGLRGDAVDGFDEPAEEETVLTILATLYVLMAHRAEGKAGFVTLPQDATLQ